MKFKLYISFATIALSLVVIGCRDKDLYPLPYDDREVGAYMRLYSLTSNVIDLNDLANSGLDGVFEAVDNNNGNILQEFRMFVSHRRGTAVTSEVPVKTIPASEFSRVTEPTFSEYTRAKIRVTATETLTALATATGFPGLFQAADQVIYRGVMVLKDGREFSNTNTTPNITGGQFYSASFVYTLTVRAQPLGSWIGAYNLTQNAIWSPNHSPALHATPQFPAYLNQRLFPNQVVTLSIPPGGLSTERQFTVSYRGQNVTMRFNLEPTPTGTAPTAGTIFVPLQNSTVDCSLERELYWTMPTSGNFTATPFPVLPAGLPQGTTANQGAYNTSQTGLVTAQFLTIGVDDDADEYGRRNGYCTWTRRVRLTLTR
ncbi:MAG: hypothetical protein ORN54_13875 [Cyclobacteriaceae bacterium]|nr:hypothetical protein [Cyclobacteriaceae bacterium]